MREYLRAILFLIGVAVLAFLVTILTTGCVRHVPKAVIATTQNFVIVQYDETHFAIRADTVQTATQAAADILGCKKGVICTISPGGIVIFVERAVPVSPQQGPRAGK